MSSQRSRREPANALPAERAKPAKALPAEAPKAPNALPARCSPSHEEGSLPVRWGLCCQFLDAPIRFRTATHRHVSRLGPDERRAYLSSVVSDNVAALRAAVERCAALGIGAFRITSQFAPLLTHPESGYALADLDDGAGIVARMREAGALARRLDVRLSFHPDQFVVLNSEREEVVRASVRELDAMASVAEIVGADTITLHGGGAAGGKDAALARLERGLDRLGAAARARIALENDDRTYAPVDLLPFCERMGVPFVYDVHHHRCLPDGLTPREATERGAATWGAREPWMHLSSPRGGWTARDPRPHHDYVAVADVPDLWVGMAVTVDVEAKAKERAVVKIKADVEGASPAELLAADILFERLVAPQPSATTLRTWRQATGDSCPRAAESKDGETPVPLQRAPKVADPMRTRRSGGTK